MHPLGFTYFVHQPHSQCYQKNLLSNLVTTSFVRSNELQVHSSSALATNLGLYFFQKYQLYCQKNVYNIFYMPMVSITSLSLFPKVLPSFLLFQTSSPPSVSKHLPVTCFLWGLMFAPPSAWMFSPGTCMTYCFTPLKFIQVSVQKSFVFVTLFKIAGLPGCLTTHISA